MSTPHIISKPLPIGKMIREGYNFQSVTFAEWCQRAGLICFNAWALGMCPEWYASEIAKGRDPVRPFPKALEARRETHYALTGF